MPRNAATNALLGLPTFSSWVKQYWSSMYTCSKHNFKAALSLVKFSYTSVIWLRYKYVGWLGHISSQCLKMIQNVSLEFLHFGIFHQFLSFLNWPVWYHSLTAKLSFSKSQQIDYLLWLANVECDFLGRFLNTMKVHLDKQSKVICNWPSSLWQSR